MSRCGFCGGRKVTRKAKHCWQCFKLFQQWDYRERAEAKRIAAVEATKADLDARENRDRLPWSWAENAVLEALMRFAGVASIETCLQRSQKAVYRQAWRLGLEWPKKPGRPKSRRPFPYVPPERAAVIFDLHAQGFKPSRIAQQAGTTRNAVIGFLWRQKRRQQHQEAAHG